MASVRSRPWVATAKRLPRSCSAITSGWTAAAIIATQRVPDLSRAARILAAAEAFQTAREARPYRPATSDSAAAARLRAAVKEGKLCHDAVETVLTAAGQPTRRASSARLAGLTPREIEVLRLIAAGDTAKEAARKLDIAPKTADNHIQSLYSKIGVTTRAGAALFALEQGLVA